MAKKKKNTQSSASVNESNPIDEQSVDQTNTTDVTEAAETSEPSQPQPYQDYADDFDLDEISRIMSGSEEPTAPTTPAPEIPPTEPELPEPEMIESAVAETESTDAVTAIDEDFRNEQDADIDALSTPEEEIVEIDLDTAADLEDSLTAAISNVSEKPLLPSKPEEYEAYLESLASSLSTFDKNVLKAVGGLSGKLFFTDVTLLISKVPEAASVLKKVNDWHRTLFGTHAACWSNSQQERQQAVAAYKKSKDADKPAKKAGDGTRDDAAIREKLRQKLESRKHLLQ